MRSKITLPALLPRSEGRPQGNLELYRGALTAEFDWEGELRPRKAPPFEPPELDGLRRKSAAKGRLKKLGYSAVAAVFALAGAVALFLAFGIERAETEGDSSIFLILLGTGGAFANIALFWSFYAFFRLRGVLARIRKELDADIDKANQIAKTKYRDLLLAFKEEERQRIEQLRHIVEGDQEAVVSFVSERLQQIKCPFGVNLYVRIADSKFKEVFILASLQATDFLADKGRSTKQRAFLIDMLTFTHRVVRDLFLLLPPILLQRLHYSCFLPLISGTHDSCVFSAVFSRKEFNAVLRENLIDPLDTFANLGARIGWTTERGLFPVEDFQGYTSTIYIDPDLVIEKPAAEASNEQVELANTGDSFLQSANGQKSPIVLFAKQQEG